MAASSLNHLDDYKRYGRQMILDGFGLPGTFARNIFHPSQLPTLRVNAALQVSLSSSRLPWSSLVLGD